MANLTKNRLHNLSNPNQGSHHKVLCVCSAGLLRSPTMAVVLSQEPFNFNTRAVGTSQDYALIPLDEAQLLWADEIVAVDSAAFQALHLFIDNSPVLSEEQASAIDVRTIRLDLPDQFEYRDPELIQAIKDQYAKTSIFSRAR